MSGCHRLCPVPGSSASVFVRSMRITAIVFIPLLSLYLCLFTCGQDCDMAFMRIFPICSVASAASGVPSRSW